MMKLVQTSGKTFIVLFTVHTGMCNMVVTLLLLARPRSPRLLHYNHNFYHNTGKERLWPPSLMILSRRKKILAVNAVQKTLKVGKMTKKKH